MVRLCSSRPLGHPMPNCWYSAALMGECGSFKLEHQNSTVNDVKNVAGSAELDCKADGHSVKGKVSFENCH